MGFHAIGQKVVDPTLARIVNEYVTEAEKRGCYIKEEVDNLEFVGFSYYLYFPTVGATSPDFKMIVLSPYATLEYIILRAVLFHELTHAVFKMKEHDKKVGEIMYYSVPDSFIQYQNPEYWQEKLDYLFSNVQGNN